MKAKFGDKIFYINTAYPVKDYLLKLSYLNQTFHWSDTLDMGESYRNYRKEVYFIKEIARQSELFRALGEE